VISAGLSLLFLLSGVWILQKQKKRKQDTGKQDCLDRALILRDLQLAFWHQLAVALLGLCALGLLLLKQSGIYLALSLTLVFLIVCTHGENLLFCRAIRAGRFVIRRKRAKVKVEEEYGGTGSRRTVHVVSFTGASELGTFKVEDFHSYGPEYYKNGGAYFLVVVNGRLARAYPEMNYRLDPSPPWSNRRPGRRSFRESKRVGLLQQDARSGPSHGQGPQGLISKRKQYMKMPESLCSQAFLCGLAPKRQRKQASSHIFEHLGTSIEHLLSSMKMMGRKRTALRLFYQLPTERELCYL
jgi:hypothetical protein